MSWCRPKPGVAVDRRGTKQKHRTPPAEAGSATLLYSCWGRNCSCCVAPDSSPGCTATAGTGGGRRGAAEGGGGVETGKKRPHGLPFLLHVACWTGPCKSANGSDWVKPGSACASIGAVIFQPIRCIFSCLISG